MAGFLRGKQTGMQKDLSAAILPGLFAPDDLAHFGLNGQVSCLAYDPVQSLLAVGTHESQIYIFGQKRVQHVLKPPRYAAVTMLQFTANRLVSVDSKNDLTIWDLNKLQRPTTYSASSLTCLVTDPGLDWAIIGQQSGEVVFYDLDREKRAPLRLPNFWHQRGPSGRPSAISPVVSLALHPRDIGQLLIAYPEGAVIYSFKQNKAIKYFEYEVPPGAIGGGFVDNAIIGQARRPRLTHALWHPHGTFILTAHDDSSLVFWDPKDGRVVMARNMEIPKVNVPGAHTFDPLDVKIREQYVRISWCIKGNEETALFIAGGEPTTKPNKALTFLELGPTPVYATSSWQVLESYLMGKRTQELPVPTEVADYCLIPRTSPFYAGAYDPIAVIVLLTSGELITLSIPSGYPISPTNQLPPTLAFVHPFVTSLSVDPVQRERWLGMFEHRSQGAPILTGGAEQTRPLRRYESRNIVQMSHGDGIVRLWDAGNGDELENNTELQVDTARALARSHDIDITKLSLAGGTGELAVGMRTGEVIIYNWGSNRLFGRESPTPIEIRAGGITNISERGEPTLKTGLQPHVLYDLSHGPVTALKICDLGFVAVGAEQGVFSIIDLRGPAVIFSASMADFTKQDKRSSFLKSSSGSASPKPDWPVVIEFGIMQLDGDDYSSILCFVGTYLGRCLTFKILPQGAGFSAQFAGVTSLEGRILSINPINPDTGKLNPATPAALGALRDGQQFPGVLVVATQTEARIFKPASTKGAHKSWDDVQCHAASVSEFDLHGFALVGVFSDSTTRAFSLPALKEIGNARLPKVDVRRIQNTIITNSGNIFVWTGPTEFAMLQVWGTGESLPPKSKDLLINPDIALPTRPTISNLQWISGTQYVSPTDLDLLIGGPDRPPSKRMLEATAAEQQDARMGNGPMSPRSPGSSTEGWGDYLTRQLNERTEKMSLFEDSMNRASESSQGFLDDVNKFVNKQKRNVIMRGVTGKFL